VAGFVYAKEAEVAVLAHFTEFGAVDYEGGVVGGAEFGAVGVVDGERDGLAAEPVADVVCVAVGQCYPDGVIEDFFEISEEVGIDEVAGLLEGVIDVVIGLGVVEVDTEGILYGSEVEILHEVCWGCGIDVWVANAGDCH